MLARCCKGAPHVSCAAVRSDLAVKGPKERLNEIHRVPKLRERIELLVVTALYAVANGSLACLRYCLWPRRRPREARRVCVYRVGNVGDCVCAVPTLYAVRRAYPKAHLTLLTSPGKRGLPGAKELLDGVDWLDEIIVYYAEDVAGLRARLRFVRELRRRAFDVWFEVPQSLTHFTTCVRNMIAARAAGPRWAYGWRLSTIKFAARTQSEFREAPNEVESLMQIVEGAGLQRVDPAFPLPIAEEHRRKVDQLLGTAERAGPPLVAIGPGAKRSTNRWPIERFAEVARHAARRGFRIVVLGGAGELESCARIAEAAGSGAVNLAGRTSLPESCEVLRRCTLAICNDSGVQHLAAAVGKPSISLFSSWQIRGKFRP